MWTQKQQNAIATSVIELEIFDTEAKHFARDAPISFCDFCQHCAGFNYIFCKDAILDDKKKCIKQN